MPTQSQFGDHFSQLLLTPSLLKSLISNGAQWFAVQTKGKLLSWHISRGSEGVVFAVIKILPAPKQHRRVIEILRSVCDLARPKPGCLGCWLSEEDSLHDGIQYIEQWDSADTLHEHIRSELYRRALEAMELSRQPPEASFHYVATVKGFELVECLRTKAVQEGEHSLLVKHA